MPRLALLLSFALPLAMLANPAAAEDKEKAVPKVLDHELESLAGEKVDLAKKYAGKVLLVVNVASECGATPQYEPLEALHEKYGEQGLAVLGFPCNQFGGQEPGTAKEIAEFCRSNYGVKFDMFAKVDVNGKQATPVYQYLTSKEAVGDKAGPVRWNFEKFLVARDGSVVKRFGTGVEPDSNEIVSAIEAELAKK
jgi:glutathione peroxidase